ncbi:MAG: hypothetical protein KC443_08510 [Anaerolineales bacterium]|nr:hypothetical protein [Anaerolineales bacterium]
MPEFGEPLSSREIDVLDCMVQGATNKEIASQLSISENTVKVHLRRIYAKLGVSTRTEAVTAAIQQGVITVPGMETVTVETPAAPSPTAPVVEAETAVSPSPPPATTAPDTPATTGKPRATRWRTVSIVLAVTLIALLLGFVGWQMFGRDDTVTVTPTAVPFTEIPIGDSRWRLNRPLDSARIGMASATIGLDVYIIGGETAVGVSNTVSIYDTTSFTWRDGTPKPTAVADTTAAVLYGEIYIPGGRLADGQPTNVVEVYSPANNAWRLATALPQPIAGALVLSQDGFLYVFGGWDGDTYLDTAYEFNPRLNSWRPLPPMTHPRAFTAGGAVAGHLYVVGGYDGQDELAICAAFDTLAESWQDCPDMLAPRAGAGGAVLLNQLYVIGGGLTADNEIPFSEEYNPNSQTWQVVNTPMLTDNGHWSYLSVTNVETRLYAIGGNLGDQLSADTYVLETVFQAFIPSLEVP